MKPIIAIVMAALIMLPAAHAGTVTLTGTCYDKLLPGNVLQFGLNNSGNDFAINLILSPNISGAEVNSSTYVISTLPPGKSANMLFKLRNISFTGSRPIDFVLTYQQGVGQTFVTVFPCMLVVGNATTEEIDMTVTTHRYADSALLNVSMTNGGPNVITANVFTMLPPELSLESGSSRIIQFGPYETKNVSFEVKFAPAVATYTGAIALAYTLNNISYGTFSYVTLNTSPVRGPSYLVAFVIVLAAVVAVFAALLFRSIKKGRKHNAAA